MLKNERGLTLVELLAAAVIMGLVTVGAISMIIYGQKTTKDIQLQNDMRTYVDLATADLFLNVYNSNTHTLTEKHQPEKVKEKPMSNEAKKWLSVNDLEKLPSQPKAYFEDTDGKITGLVIDKEEKDDHLFNKMNVYSNGRKIDLYHKDFYISEHSYIEPLQGRAGDTAQMYKIVLYVVSKKEQRAFAMESILYSFSDGRKVTTSTNK